MSDILSITELAEKLKLAKQTIYQWVSMKKIPYYKLGNRVLFSEKAINEWLEEHHSKAIK